MRLYLCENLSSCKISYLNNSIIRAVVFGIVVYGGEQITDQVADVFLTRHYAGEV